MDTFKVRFPYSAINIARDGYKGESISEAMKAINSSEQALVRSIKRISDITSQTKANLGEGLHIFEQGMNEASFQFLAAVENRRMAYDWLQASAGPGLFKELLEKYPPNKEK